MSVVGRHGIRTACAQVGGLRVSDIAFQPHTTSPPHVHDHDCVAVVLSGEMEKDDRALSNGAVAYTPAGMTHVDHLAEAGARAIAIELLDGVEGLSERRAAGLRLPWLGRRLAAELAATDAAAPLALHAAALDLLATVGRAPEGPKPSTWLDEVADHLHDRLFERVTLDELAAVAGVHRAHLVRAFRARYGVSIGVYVRRERIRWAARALRHSDAPLAEIALRAGFADQSHFTTYVRQAHRRAARSVADGARASAASRPRRSPDRRVTLEVVEARDQDAPVARHR